MMFHVGQKVVCIDDTRREFGLREWDNRLRRGIIYTIRWVGKYGVKLVEINRRTRHVSDTYYFADRFRPVIERKTDISIFTAMLAPTSIRDSVKG